MKIAFLRDPMKDIDPNTETTLLLMYECYRRGHQVFFLEFHDLYIRDNRVMGRMHEIISAPGLDLLAYWQSAIDCVENDKLGFEEVSELDALFLRTPPPLHYEVMQLLSSVEEQVFMVNSLRGQLLGNSKLYTLNFPDVIPESHVSRDPDPLAQSHRRFWWYHGDETSAKFWRAGGHQSELKGPGEPQLIDRLLPPN